MEEHKSVTVQVDKAAGKIYVDGVLPNATLCLYHIRGKVIEVKQAIEMSNIYSSILSGTMDAFASIISNNVNAIMKRMTSLSITLMIPTLIASFYGMNVDIHLEGFPYAFIFIILISVILSAGTFIWFRKIKWF